METKSQMIMRIAELSEQNTELRAEIEELHLKYAGCKTANNGLQELNAELKAENEKLKEEITKLQDTRYQIAKVNEGYYNRMIKYRQCLKEIKEYCEEQNLKADYTACAILDKISDILEDTENE